MAKRFETGIIDKLINKKLLGKRVLDLPLRSLYPKVRNEHTGMFVDRLYFPKSKFDKVVANIYERCMPGLKYFMWDENVYWAREHGYTLGEKMFHSFRHAPIALLHSMAQAVHPYGWLEAQRRDAYFRRVETLMPGVKIPDWAQQNRRVKDVDVNSINVPLDSFGNILKEATPTQHMNTSLYAVVYNLVNQRNQIGFASQRLFYNEKLRGDFYANGLLTKKEREVIHGWYADTQNESMKQRIDGLSEKERAEYERNKERWDKNFEEFYPELKNRTHNKILHKFDEPYFERNMQEIRGAIFTSKWIESVDKFNSEEIQQIHEFFLNGNTSAFFSQNSADEESQPTELYKKFVNELGFPDIFQIDRFTTYPPEKQFYDLMDKNWGINFDTVESYRAQYINLIKNNPNTEASSLVLEEVYNPLFRHLLKEKFNYDLGQTDSFVLRAVNDGASLNELNEIAHGARENVYLTSKSVLENMVNTQVREIVKTFVWKGNL